LSRTMKMMKKEALSSWRAGSDDEEGGPSKPRVRGTRDINHSGGSNPAHRCIGRPSIRKGKDGRMTVKISTCW